MKKKIVIIVVGALLVGVAAWAAWVVNGNPVSTAAGTQDFIAMTANGLGGAVMVWQDNRGASQDIYAQQINQLGANEWTANGVALCTATGLQQSPRIGHDIGYVFYVWQDYRNGNADIYAAATDRLGNIFTTSNGLTLCNATGDQSSFSLGVSTGFGAGYAAWADARSGTNDIYAQAFNPFGTLFWPANGLLICNATNDQTGTAIVADFPGAGDGATIVWQDFRNGNYDIYAQRANLGGATQWTANGVVVCNQAAAQIEPMVIKDGAGGVIIAWEDRRNGTFQQAIYAQRLNSAGAPQWAANGVLVAQSSDLIESPKMVPDTFGGAVIAWEDDRNIATTGPDIYAQRIDSNGNTLWAANGVVVCNANFAQYQVDMAPDGSNGAIITWFDYRNLSTTDVYAQRVSLFGTLVWAANGIPVGAATGNQSNPHIAKTDDSGVIVAWEDRRNLATTNTDVYAQRIDKDSGQLGYLAPYITAIVDTPNDQGGSVRLTFRQGDGQVAGEEFEIFNVDYHGGDVVWVGTFNGSEFYTVDVLNTGVGIANTYYISAGGYQSNQVQGTSLDNLAPPAPTLAGQRNGNNVELSWNATAGDIDHYVLQRADLGPIVVSGTSYTDVGAPLTTLYYRVNAVDIHNNAGPNSNQVTIDQATPIGDTPRLPRQLALLPNTPNPFSGSTSLRIGLPAEANVALDVFDVAGRRVVSRNLGRLGAGWRNIAFDGHDDHGQPLASGVYFYRVIAGNETMTRKMVIGR